MSINDERNFHIKLARISDRKNTLTSFGIGLLFAGLGIGAVTVTIDYLQSFVLLARFLVLYVLMGMLIVGGSVILSEAKKEFSSSLRELAGEEKPNPWSKIEGQTD